MKNNELNLLDSIHKKLEQKFIRKPQEEKDALELEEFFNYIVYDRDIISDKNPFQKLISEGIKNELQQSSYIQNLYKGFTEVESANKLGYYGEQGFAYLVTAAISLLERDKKIDKTLQQTMDRVLHNKSIEDIIIGDQFATMMPKEVLQQIIEEIQQGTKSQKAFSGLFKKYGIFALRQGKIDNNMALLSLDITANKLAKRLSKMTISVKNYNKNLIHLENVSILKAYQAYHFAINKNKNIKKINEEYANVILKYVKDNNKYKEDFKHIIHFVNLYALTGMGQSYINKGDIVNEINPSMVQSKLGAQYLMVNQRSAKKIYVIPTASISALSLNKQSASCFYYGAKGASIEPIVSSNNKNIDVSLNIYQAHKQILNK